MKITITDSQILRSQRFVLSVEYLIIFNQQLKYQTRKQITSFGIIFQESALYVLYMAPWVYSKKAPRDRVTANVVSGQTVVLQLIC